MPLAEFNSRYVSPADAEYHKQSLDQFAAEMELRNLSHETRERRVAWRSFCIAAAITNDAARQPEHRSAWDYTLATYERRYSNG